MNYQF
jgi:hypothetical protein